MTYERYACCCAAARCMSRSAAPIADRTPCGSQMSQRASALPGALATFGSLQYVTQLLEVIVSVAAPLSVWVARGHDGLASCELCNELNLSDGVVWWPQC